MSSASTAWAWEKIKGGHVSGVTALVLLKLSDRADDDGKCWPGHKRTAVDCNINVRSARRAVASLLAAGLLRQEARKGTGKNGADQSNYYFVGVARGEGNRPSPPDGSKTPPPVGTKPSPDGSKTPQNHKEEPTNLNQQPQPPRAQAAPVVVVTEEDQAQLIWPAGLAEGQLSSIRNDLLGKNWPGVAAAQALLDELAGQLAVPGKVRNAAGLLRRLLERQRDGLFTLEHGLEVQQIREARQKHQEREAAALAGKVQGMMTPAAAGASATSEAARRRGLEELAKLRETFGRPPAKSGRQAREARI